MSTAYHPQTDGHSEHIIQTLEDMLRAYVIDFGGSWDVHLPLPEFSYNNNYHTSIRCSPFEALYGRKCKSPVLWAKIGEGSLIRPELVQETTNKVVVIKEMLQAARDRQKSYADSGRKMMEYEVGENVLLKVSPWKGVMRFGKKGKLTPRYVGPFEILERIDPVAYRLRLPEELIGVHDTFHVSNLKKCLGNANLHVPLNEIKIDKTLRFVEELVEIMDRTMLLNMDQLEKKLDNEEFQEIGSMAAFKVLETQFQMLIKSRIYLDDEYVDTSSGSGNDAHAVDEDIRPIYDEEPMAEVQTTAEINVFATRQQHTEQLEFNNEGEVDQNAEQCHNTCPLPAKLTDNQTTELSNQSLESKNISLKKTVAQFQKDFLRIEAHCVNLELKYQNQALKEGQHGQFLNVKSNEAKVKHEIDVIETINIELENKVAKLLKENATLKKHYKELYDSIKTTRARNIKHTTSLIAKNDEFKAQLQEKGFAITALKNALRKLSAKSSILGKPILQPHRNQSVVRQPTAFKSERPRISKPRFASQVDVNNDLSKPITT
ncbi:actin-binding, cofilin/tropomyosin type protein, partial [Tanacetum coccineum]